MTVWWGGLPACAGGSSTGTPVWNDFSRIALIAAATSGWPATTFLSLPRVLFQIKSCGLDPASHPKRFLEVVPLAGMPRPKLSKPVTTASRSLRPSANSHKLPPSNSSFVFTPSSERKVGVKSRWLANSAIRLPRKLPSGWRMISGTWATQGIQQLGLLLDAALLAEVRAVVGAENHDRIVPEPQFLHVAQQPADAMIAESHLGGIQVAEDGMSSSRMSRRSTP